jgi:hypothetical protein
LLQSQFTQMLFYLYTSGCFLDNPYEFQHEDPTALDYARINMYWKLRTEGYIPQNWTDQYEDDFVPYEFWFPGFIGYNASNYTLSSLAHGPGHPTKGGCTCLDGTVVDWPGLAVFFEEGAECTSPDNCEWMEWMKTPGVVLPAGLLRWRGCDDGGWCAVDESAPGCAPEWATEQDCMDEVQEGRDFGQPEEVLEESLAACVRDLELNGAHDSCEHWVVGRWWENGAGIELPTAHTAAWVCFPVMFVGQVICYVLHIRLDPSDSVESLVVSARLECGVAVLNLFANGMMIQLVLGYTVWCSWASPIPSIIPSTRWRFAEAIGAHTLQFSTVFALVATVYTQTIVSSTERYINISSESKMLWWILFNVLITMNLVISTTVGLELRALHLGAINNYFGEWTAVKLMMLLLVQFTTAVYYWLINRLLKPSGVTVLDVLLGTAKSRNAMANAQADETKSEDNPAFEQDDPETQN